jgi:hypothetical protein
MRASAHTLLNFHSLRVTISYQILWRILPQPLRVLVEPTSRVSPPHCPRWHQCTNTHTHTHTHTHTFILHTFILTLSMRELSVPLSSSVAPYVYIIYIICIYTYIYIYCSVSVSVSLALPLSLFVHIHIHTFCYISRDSHRRHAQACARGHTTTRRHDLPRYSLTVVCV